MALGRNLRQAGFDQHRVLVLAGAEAPAVTVSAAGTAQSDATVLSVAANLVTTVAASSGVSLPILTEIGDEVLVANGGANALLVYPPADGSNGKINNLTANAGYSIAVNKGARFLRLTATVWLCTGA